MCSSFADDVHLPSSSFSASAVVESFNFTGSLALHQLSGLSRHSTQTGPVVTYLQSQTGSPPRPSTASRMRGALSDAGFLGLWTIQWQLDTRDGGAISCTRSYCCEAVMLNRRRTLDAPSAVLIRTRQNATRVGEPLTATPQTGGLTVPLCRCITATGPRMRSMLHALGDFVLQISNRALFETCHWQSGTTPPHPLAPQQARFFATKKQPRQVFWNFIRPSRITQG